MVVAIGAIHTRGLHRQDLRHHVICTIAHRRIGDHQPPVCQLGQLRLG